MKQPVWKVINQSFVYIGRPTSHLLILLYDPTTYLSEKMKQALAKKDLDLATAQKEAREKIALAHKKLASVGA